MDNWKDANGNATTPPKWNDIVHQKENMIYCCVPGCTLKAKHDMRAEGTNQKGLTIMTLSYYFCDSHNKTYTVDQISKLLHSK